MLPDEKSKPEQEEEFPGDDLTEHSESSDLPKRRRTKVKIRKKIRIKQKPSAKKLISKIAERAFWVIIIAGFIASLIVMIIDLDVRDEKFKQQRKKSMPTK